jgi:thioredoxin-dependent peroxiredoxin
MMPPVNKAPDFNLLDQSGQPHSLESYKGKWLVLYVYPKDDTPGCTAEACDFRDHVGHLRELGAEVVGLSADSSASHDKFATKHGLNFPLLADDGAVTIKALGAWGEKSMYGKTFEGIMRQTFLIDPKGQIVKTWNKVSVKGHVADVEKALREAQAA